MSDKPKFFLAPSRFGRPAGADDKQNSTKPNFTGLKESKLGILAESKLTPASGAVDTGGNTAVTAKTDTSGDQAKAPVTFNFTPLTKPTEEKEKPKSEDVENKNPFQEKKEDPKPAEKFVFGQNLTERVENVDSKAEDDKNEEASAETETAAKESANTESSKNSDLLFSNSVNPSTKTEEESSKTTGKTLSEAAAEYTETHSNKRKYDVVDVVTGEEEESNVFQVNVKLYIFDTDKKNWVERGRGMLRLNDDPSSTVGHLRSRLVMRTVGSLRVVLNTKLFPNMVCEKANEKNVRISAQEEGVLKVFLISGSPKDADKIYTALEYRINQLTNESKDESKDDEDGEPPEKKVAKSEENSSNETT